MTEPATFLDTLVAALQGAANYNSSDQEAPAAVLWPDAAHEWEPLLPRLRARLSVLTLGPYLPEEQSGPVAWLRCMIARRLPGAPMVKTTPVIYLPGLASRQLDSLEQLPGDLARLAEIRYRSVCYAQPDGTEWTAVAFFSSQAGGLGVPIRQDSKTRAALRRALPMLADLPLARLHDNEPWKASDFDALIGFPPSTEVTTAELIAQGESRMLEFKSSARWDIKQSKLNKDLEKPVVKTVAAFLNSAEGGTLLIGVDNDGVALGLDNDYQTFSAERRNLDGYELWLMGLLLKTYGKDFAPYIKIIFPIVDGLTICRVDVAPGPQPVYVTEAAVDIFYVRTGNATNSLTTREAVSYSRNRWGGTGLPKGQ